MPKALRTTVVCPESGYSFALEASLVEHLGAIPGGLLA